jgi:nuclear GTP-binding protein
LNKTDLVPTPVVKSWLAHLRRHFPTVAFKSSINSQKAALGGSGGLTANDAMGADQLISLLKNYCRNLNIKTAITVGVVGYPNVGKSSLINSLKRSKVCRVGATPGVTTTAQYVHLDRNITLLDCPGIVFSTGDGTDNNDSIFLRNVLKVEQIEDPVAPISAILKRVPRDQIVCAFGCSWTAGLEIGDPEDVSSFLRAIAESHGRLKKGGVPDIESAARFVLKEWNAGKVKYWNEPPSTSTDTGADTCAIVGELAPEFAFDDAWLGNNSNNNNDDDDCAMDTDA